uniref:AAA+ ATPase domain-containing protein n=4 Tax=Aegilops tauschii subsp. strangulata TaxID=200361 RepID=A0A453Q6X2_AEGTS
GAVVSASMGVIGPLLAELTILCARLPEGRPKREMEFFEEKLRSIQEMVSSLHTVKMSHMVEEDTLLKKRWAKQAREIAYDTQDFVDLFRHSAGLSLSDDTAGVMPKTAGRLKKLRRFSSRPKQPRLDRDMVNKVEELKARMTEVIERHRRFKIAMDPSSPPKEDVPGCSGHQIQIQSEASSSGTRTSSSRCPSVPIDAYFSALYAGGDGLVGIDGPSHDLTALLMDDMQQLKVVSVLGPEGIGKTTLVREVYRNIRGRFECCAFVSMSPKTGIQEILQAFRSQLGAQDGASVEACQEERFTHKLIQILKGKRYFVVLDGVWSTRAWRLIRCALPGNNHGSRILMTTCIDNIAKSCCSTTGDSIYQVKCLPELEGRRLFIERTFGLEKWQFPSWLKEVSSEISRTCGGWPIVILTVASLLATKSSSEDHWKMIQGSIGLALVRPHRREGLALEQSQVHSYDSLLGVKNILYICYNDLPQHLKTCLLYLSIYPEGYVIGRDHLIRRWIAEGFISVRSEHDNLEEVGQCYFNELINRGMIQPVGIQYDGRADACQVHSLILGLIVSISAEENFVTLSDGQDHELGTTDKVRRLSLNYHGQQHFVVPSTITSSPVRSLTIFGSAKDAPIFSNSQVLRVFDLDVRGDPGKKYLGTIGCFYQLKYLRLQMSGVVELPEQIGELQFLETLDLTKTSIRKLPRSILHLWRLVYLLVCNVELPEGLGDMRSLEELSGIQVKTTNSTNSLLGVGQLTKLRTVQLIWSISDACGDIKGYEDNLLSSLKELSKLQSLTIESRDGSALSFLDSWSPHPQLLQKLYLTGGYYFPRIPERIISLVNLDFLEISVYQVQDEMMNVLGSLPALVVLSLSSQVAAPEQRIVVQPGLFHCLTKFTLICLNKWTGLVIEPEALPKLARLGLLCYVQGQRDPVCGDYGIKYLSSLKNLHVEITFGRAGIWEVVIRSAKSPPPQVQISDKHHMVEEAEIIEAVESLSTHESIQEESAIYKDAKMDSQSSQEGPEEYKAVAGRVRSICDDMSPRIHPHKLTSASSELAFHNREVMESALVSAATGSLKPVREKLATLLGDEYKRFKGVRREIRSLTHELAAMETFLLKMSEVDDPDSQDIDWMNKVRDLSYDMEDAIDDFMQSIRDNDEKPDGFIERIKNSLGKLGKMKARRRIGDEIQDLKKQIIEVGKRNARYKSREAFSKTMNATVDPRVLAMFEHASKLVGIDEPKFEIIELLTLGEDVRAPVQQQQPNIVSIVGSGGMGKTSLAKQVYQDLKGQYECHAFISVSRNPDMINIFRTILTELVAKKYDGDTEVGSIPQLISKITDFLADKRYFVVVDDIWDVDTWDIIKRAFPTTTSSSSIITTTRMKNVARSCSLFNGYVYNISPLNMVHSRQLLHRRIFKSDEDCPSYLKNVSDEILKKCAGLPLAIIAISGLLANTEKTEDQWNKVKDSIGRALERNASVKGMMKILSLSYYDLPPYLKTCLLYMSIYLEDNTIEKEGLIRRWIAERFIIRKGRYTAYELGERCFNELLNRGLIQPGEINQYGTVKSCRVHGTILDFIISKSIEENFITLLGVPILKIGNQSIVVRRLWLQGVEEGNSTALTTGLVLSRVRSLTMVRGILEIPSLEEFRHVRVLDLMDCSKLEDRHVETIVRLFHLRYLNLRGTRISKLPEQIGRLGCLEILDLRHTCLEELPASVINLRKLSNLLVDCNVKFPDGIAKMQALEMLEEVSVSIQPCDFLWSLGQLKNLRNLELDLESDTKDTDKSVVAEERNKAIVSSLCKLGIQDIRSLTICEGSSLLQEPLCLPTLEKLITRNSAIPHVPTWVSCLRNLQHLRIQVLVVKQDDLCILGALPSLLILHLIDVTKSNEKLRISGEVGFQFLRIFIYDAFLQPTDLMFGAGSMPKLEKLVLQCLRTVEADCLDFGIENLPCLNTVKVGGDYITLLKP